MSVVPEFEKGESLQFQGEKLSLSAEAKTPLGSALSDRDEGGYRMWMKRRLEGVVFWVMTDGLHSVRRLLRVINGAQVECGVGAFMKPTGRRFEMSAPILLWFNRCLHKAVC